MPVTGFERVNYQEHTSYQNLSKQKNTDDSLTGTHVLGRITVSDMKKCILFRPLLAE